jgi:signal transduction histidine kinase
MADDPPRQSRDLAGRLRGSVRVRITAGAVAVVGVALLAGGLALVFNLRAALADEVRVSATVRADGVAQFVVAGGDLASAVLGEDVVVQLFAADGTVLAGSGRATRSAVLPSLAPGQSRVVAVPFEDGGFIAVAAPAGPGRTVVLAQSLDPVEESTQALVTLLAIGLPALLLLVAATTWRVVGRALAPVDTVRCEVDAISAAHLDRRVPRPVGNDEIARLAQTMNRMLDRIERSVNRERRFVADASHELRSPIAAIREHAEVAMRHPGLGAGLAASVHAESLRMQSIVDDLLMLARADANTLIEARRPVDLDDLVLAEARRLRDREGPTVDTRGLAAARIDGDPAALRRVLRNLGDNAARHARSRIAVAVSEQDGWAELMVDDDGPGVPLADRDRVFERFVRLDCGRARADGGSGLGLAIVAEVVAAHGGTVALGDSPLGGARITVRLPGAS